MPDQAATHPRTSRRLSLAAAAAVLAICLHAPLPACAEAATTTKAAAATNETTGGQPAAEESPGWRRSLPKALTYQTIVVGTDQLLYWTMITGTPSSELAFLAGNAVSGVAYYVAFDAAWDAAGREPPPSQEGVDVSKALVYRVFDTLRAFAVARAVGTPVTGSVALAAAIAATRTGIYLLHDYAWSVLAPERQ